MATKIWIGTDTGNEGDWATAANWSPSGVPEAGDDVYFENSSQSVTEGFDQSAITLGSLHIAQSYTGYIGTAAAYLQVSATVVEIGSHSGPGTPLGSGRLKIALGSVQSAITVNNSAASAADTYRTPIQLTNTHAASTLTVNKGKVGFCTGTGETGQLATLTLNYVGNQSTDAEVYVGSGVTLATVKKYGGKLDIRCAVTTYTVYAGSDLIAGSGALGTIYVKGGTVESNTTGTITTAEVSGGTLDLSKSSAARTITTLKVDSPGKIKYDPAVVTLTNKIQPITAAGVIAYQAQAS